MCGDKLLRQADIRATDREHGGDKTVQHPECVLDGFAPIDGRISVDHFLIDLGTGDESLGGIPLQEGDSPVPDATCPMLHSRDACRMQHMADAVSHDQNFKNLIVDYPREALAFFAAAEAPRPEDDVRIVPVRQEQLKERLGDRYRALDAPLLVDWADGRRDAVVFALEEESDWRRFSPHRLARYCLDLAEMFDTDRVVPVAIFLRAADRAPASLVLGTGRRHYLVFDYLACKLAEMPAGRWLDSDNLVARVNLPNMRSPARDRVDVYARAVHGQLTLETDGARQAKYMEFIDIYAGRRPDGQ